MSAAKNLHDLYEEDYHLWSLENARLMREKKLSDLDLENIVEELESMGKQERGKLESFLNILFLHLLKWQYQPSFQSRSWSLSIAEHRKRAKDHLKENPSLKGHLANIVKHAYEYSRYEAARETGLALKKFPVDMPFTIDEALTDDWLPQSE